MTGFLLAMIATFLAGFGGRDQVLVATFADRQGQRPALLLVALVSAVLAAGTAIWLAGAFAPGLTLPVRRMLAALALGLAALDMLLIRPRTSPQEPTQSLGAFGIVLLSQQLMDASRFLLFAISLASILPGAAGIGGALGGAAVVTLGWAGGRSLLDLPLVRIRRWLGGLLLVLAAGLVVFFRVTG
jgi:Ca2+/H+ antiporter, TMEM165/GDT1 family